MKTNRDFYQNLPESHTIEDVFNSELSCIVPTDWILIITDVVQSTKAIEAGQYKDVNTAGGLTVMAIANLLESLDFPFVFGGDGVTMLIPNDLADAARAVLADAQIKIQQAFNLQIRIGMIPIETLQAQGYELRIAKLRISPQYTQAIIDGDGFEVAESWIKSSDTNNPFLVLAPQNGRIEADFSGFTCRWQDVPSEKGEIIALIVKFRAQNAAIRKKELADFLTFLINCYGEENEHHPIQAKQMRASGLYLLLREIRICGVGQDWLTRCCIAVKITLQIGFIRLMQLLHIPIRLLWFDILRLKEINAISSDFRKFDGSLKMVISGTTNSRNQLTRYLESEYQKGKLYYGLHVSNRAVLTCLMHIGSCGEVHFVDGADGGYAMAAKQLKKQITQLS